MDLPKRTGMLALWAAVCTALIVAGCGSEGPTATPLPTATPVPPAPTIPRPTSAPAPTATTAAPVPTSAPAATATAVPTATSVPRTPTAVPRPTATPAPAGVATPVIVTGGKRGGVLQTSIRTSYVETFDTFSAGGRAAVSAYSQFLNSLLWIDPHGDGKTLVGDVAAGWAFGDAGKVITFTLRRGIQFHDGKPLTSKDVAYNVERAWKPRAPTMTEFAGKLDSLQKIETPDDFTLRLTLSKPSNFLLLGLSSTQFLVYPAHMTLPESNAAWKGSGIGSGPYKMKSGSSAKIEATRNDAYFRTGLPYLDGIVFNGINDDGLVASGYRTGRLDAVTIDHGPIQNLIADGTLLKEQGFTSYRVVGGARVLQFAQKAPWTDPRVREAVDLALDRQGIADSAHQGRATPYGGILLPPELGGLWGIPSETLKTTPGYRPDKTQDIARAKQLLQAAGVDPSTVKVRILAVAATPNPDIATLVESSLRSVGFKPDVVIQETAQRLATVRAGNYEINVEIASIQADDPLDFQVAFFKTGGGLNPAKWSNPEVDRIFEEQDTVLDLAKRKALLQDLQAKVMQDRFQLMAVWYFFFRGTNGYVKNYPKNLRFTFDPYYRWEQIWLER